MLPACADWSQLETLAKEREMIGHYLSAHPLDDYKISSIFKIKAAPYQTYQGLSPYSTAR